MNKETSNNVKLGLFVAIGVVVLTVSLYLISGNQSLLGSNFKAKARFKNINGLMVGNNIRFSGIQGGAVTDIVVVNDTTIEVLMVIDNKLRPFVHKNTYASIGSEGLVGNKVVNIIPNSEPGPVLEDGGMLLSPKTASADEMFETLSKSNNNVEVISEGLKATIDKVNNSKALWALLNDSTLTPGINSSLDNIKAASDQIKQISVSLRTITNDIHAGKGAAGVLLNDQATAQSTKEIVDNVHTLTKESNSIMHKLDTFIYTANNDVVKGPGAAHLVLRDKAFANKLDSTMSNLQHSTAAFNENMEALKHNFLLRGYFKKEAKRNKRNKAKTDGQ